MGRSHIIRVIMGTVVVHLRLSAPSVSIRCKMKGGKWFACPKWVVDVFPDLKNKKLH